MTEQFDRFLIWIPDHFAAPARIVLILILASIALRAIHRLLPRLRETIAARQESVEDGQRIRTLSRVVRYALTVATAVVTVLLILGGSTAAAMVWESSLTCLMTETIRPMASAAWSVLSWMAAILRRM